MEKDLVLYIESVRKVTCSQNGQWEDVSMDIDITVDCLNIAQILRTIFESPNNDSVKRALELLGVSNKMKYIEILNR